MKIFKPSWVSHDGNPIFSVDIHPDGSRFATGGQGPDKCGRVIIWNMAPLLSEKDENREQVPKILCQLDNHLACVNCVRWSSTGKYLASAGDDKNLMIWQIAGRFASHYMPQPGNSSFGSPNIEQWRCVTTLHGHGGDILHLAWSMDDSFLASSSVDNMIVIWDAKNFPQVLTKITGHTGLVKGVVWDPIGKYLASQSDDKTVRIWRTNDWKEEIMIDEPFKECGGTTHVLRLDWSPDGQLLVSAHAMNNCGSTAQIIERDGWVAERDFVGHRKAVTCVRFNPHIITPLVNKKDNSEQANGTTKGGKNSGAAKPTKMLKYCCAAIGSRDSSLSVWLTHQPRPLAVAHDLFESSVLDISWSQQHPHLIACSQDGSVAVLIFSPDELGRMLTAEEKLLHQQKLYGKSVANNSGKQLLAEDPDILRAQTERIKAKEIKERLEHNIEPVNQNQNSRNMSLNGYESSPCKNSQQESNSNMGLSKNPTDKQIETLMPGGVRRITPLYLPPIMNYDGSPQPFNSNSDSITFSSSKESKTRITIEIRDDSRSSATTQSPQKGGSQPMAINPSAKSEKSPTDIVVSDSPHDHGAAKQTPSTAANNSTANPNNANGNSNWRSSMGHINGGESLLANKDTQAQTNNKTPSAQGGELVDNLGTKITPKENLNKSLTGASNLKRKLTADGLSGSNKKGKLTKTNVATKEQSSNKSGTNQKNESSTHRNVNNSTPLIQAPTSQLKSNATGSKRDLFVKFHLMPALSIEKTSDVKVIDSLGRQMIVEIENNCQSTKIHEVRSLDEDNNRRWEALLSSKICALSASASLTAIICIDHTLHVYETISGRRLRPPIILSAAPSHVAIQKDHLLLITTRADFWLWDFASNRAIVCAESIVHLLSAMGPPDAATTRTTKSSSKSNDADSNHHHSGSGHSSGVEILSCSLTEQLQPLLLLSTGRALIYDLDLKIWSLLSDTNDLVSIWSEQKSSIMAITRSLPTSVVDNYDKPTLLKKVLPLATVQSQHSIDIRRYSQMLTKNSAIGAMQPIATRSYLDQQVASALALKSSHEFRFWMLQSVTHFVESGCESRLKELCSDLVCSLLGASSQQQPSSDSTRGNEFLGRTSSILGLCKRELLSDVLSIMATDLRYQRLYAEYKQQLEFACPMSSTSVTGAPTPMTVGNEIDSADQSSL